MIPEPVTYTLTLVTNTKYTMTDKLKELFTPERSFFTLSILFICLLRLVFVGKMGMMPQDAYYNFYADHLSLSYYDHPPAIAYILKLFTLVFGRNVFALKLADTVVTLCTIYVFYKLACLFLSRYEVQKAMILLLSTFMVTILSLISTPDVPLLLFWSLSLLMLYKAVFQQKKWHWLWVGLCIGLAFDSKYTALFLPAGVLVFLILSPAHRKLLLSPWPWLAFALFVITISPVIIWNVQNHFASFRFQSQQRIQSAEASGFNITYFFGVLGHQSAILMPVLFFSLLVFLYQSIKKYKLRIATVPAPELFLLCFFLPLFGSFLLLSLFYWIKLNWLMPAYITGIIWISRFFTKKWLKYQVIFTLVIHIALAIEILFYPFLVKSDDTWVGWKQLAKKVEQIKSTQPVGFIFSADDYKTSAVLNFYMNDMVYGQNIIGKPALQFDFIGSDLFSLKGENALFINSSPSFKNLQKENAYPEEMHKYFDTIVELDPIIITKNGRPVRKFLVFECRNYKPGINVNSLTHTMPATLH